MMAYFWIYFLATVSIFSLSYFVLTLSPTIILVKKLRLSKKTLVLNWLFIVIAIASLSLLIYLFYQLKIQLGIMI